MNKTHLLFVALVLILSCTLINCVKPTAAVVTLSTNRNEVVNITNAYNILRDSAKFALVDFIYFNTSVTASFLSKYEVVFACPAYVKNRKTSALGNVLDQLLKMGKTGIVVSADGIGEDRILGNWDLSDQVIPQTTSHLPDQSLQLVKLQPNHPIFINVSSIKTDGIAASQTVTTGSTILGNGARGHFIHYVMVATKLVHGLFRRVDVNLYYKATNPGYFFYGDGYQLLINSMLWAAGDLNRCQQSTNCQTCTLGQSVDTVHKCEWCETTQTCGVYNPSSTCRNRVVDEPFCPPPKCTDYTSCTECVANDDCIYCANKENLGCIAFNGGNNPCLDRIGSAANCPSQ